MNLFNDRWLVLIGGETSIDPLEVGSSGKTPKEDEMNKSKNSAEIHSTLRKKKLITKHLMTCGFMIFI